MVSVTVPCDENLKAAIRRAAKQKHLSMSAYIRLALVDAVAPRNNRRINNAG